MDVKVERKIFGGWQDVTDYCESGRVSYSRPFSSVGSSVAVLDIHESSEVIAYTNYPKGQTIRITSTRRNDQGFLDGSVLLLGKVERHSWSEDNKSVRVTVKDPLYLKLKEKTAGMLFVDKTFTEIVTLVANEIDFSVSFSPNASGSYVEPEIGYYYIEPETTFEEILRQLADATGGRIYASPGLETPTLVVEQGCLIADASIYDPDPYVEIGADDAAGIALEYPPRAHNRWVIDCHTKTHKIDTLYLATIDNGFSIPSGGVGVGDNEHYIEFEMPVLKVIANNIDFTGCPDVVFDATTYNSNFVDSNPAGYLINPNRLRVKFTNSSGFSRELLYWNMKIQGVDQQMIEVAIDDSSEDGYTEEWLLDSPIIVEDEGWNKRRMNWEKAFPQEELSFTVVNPAIVPLIGTWVAEHSDPGYTIDYDGALIVAESLEYSMDKDTWEISGRADRSAYDSTVCDSTTTYGPTVPEGQSTPSLATPSAPTLSSESRLDNKVYLLITIADAGEYEARVYNNTLFAEQTYLNIVGATSPFVAAVCVNENQSYKASIRHIADGEVSEWSDWSSNHTTTTSEVPNAPVLGSLEKAYTYISIVTATWTHTKKDNHSHYEVEVYEGTGEQKKLIGIYSTVQQTLSLPVTENILVSVRVRAVDVNGKVSDWSNEETTTSLYDTAAPATPTSAELIGCATGILFFWVASYDPRRLYFEVQRTYADTADSWEMTWYTKEDYFEDTTAVDGKYYYYRVRAVKPNSVTSGWLTSGSSGDDILEGKISNFRVGSIDAGKITTGYLDAARIEARTIHASKLAIMSETDDKIELENNIEIGASVGPAGIGGIYVYDAAESGQGYILNSNGLYYTNGLKSASMLMSLMRQELLFNSTVSLTDGIVVPLPFAIKPERLAVNATFKALQGGGTAAQKRYIQTVPILDVSGKVEAIRVLAYQMEATNTLIPTKYKSSGALYAVFPGGANSVSLLKLYANLDWMWVNWGSTVYETQMISFVLPNHAYSGTVSGNRTAYLNVNSFTRTKSGLYYKSYKFNYSITWGDTTSATYDSPWFTVPSKWGSEWRNDYPSLVSYDSQSYYTIDATKSAIEAIVELNVHLLGGG